MSKIFTLLLTFLFSLPLQAEDFPQLEIQSQQNDEETCIQQFLDQCLDKCEDVKGGDCQAACQTNAQNECRQAGE